MDSRSLARPSARELLTLEYFEAEPGEMPALIFDEHHVLLNLREEPQQVENRRDGRLRKFTLTKDEIVVTPAGVRSGWRWFERSKVIVVTLQPAGLERFALSEVGVVLTDQQLRDLPQFSDPQICSVAVMLRDALTCGEVGSAVLYESMARVFLVKLIQRYGERRSDEIGGDGSFTAERYKRLLEFIQRNYAESITLDDLAREAGWSRTHFSRLFRSQLGRSPMQFVIEFRVEQAKKRLALPDIPLLDVALSCGFADQAHFSRVFKQFERISPKAYRDSLRT